MPFVTKTANAFNSPVPAGETVSESDVEFIDGSPLDALYASESEFETSVKETTEEEVYVEQTAPAIYYSTGFVAPI